MALLHSLLSRGLDMTEESIRNLIIFHKLLSIHCTCGAEVSTLYCSLFTIWSPGPGQQFLPVMLASDQLRKCVLTKEHPVSQLKFSSKFLLNLVIPYHQTPCSQAFKTHVFPTRLAAYFRSVPAQKIFLVKRLSMISHSIYSDTFVPE